ncbi:PAS domain-containing protein [Aestuariibacter halophilus]|uniref:PAS domain-containing protein n=1 Tax=Fluctibacter halophilus TaxID=226011 RepID=A0ABS8G6L5_9ALTE|nr:PAS domain-containing protein [Aestuariibacter halophilus]MCC2615726.1 PAS domain-containing protein [Aestuariibacter halophilus]
MPIPTQTLNALPVAMLLVQPDPNTGVHYNRFVSQPFTDLVGWSLADIPDKPTWWEKAYPDPGYRDAIERQWELAVEVASEENANTVSMEANITCKSGRQLRCKVTAVVSDDLVRGHYFVFFEPVSD